MTMTQEDFDLNYSALAADLTDLNTKYSALRLAVITSLNLDGGEPLEEQVRDFARVQREVKRNAIAAAVAAEREAWLKRDEALINIMKSDRSIPDETCKSYEIVIRARSEATK